MLPRNQLLHCDSEISSSMSFNMLASKLFQFHLVSKNKMHPRLLLHACKALASNEKLCCKEAQVKLANMPVQNLNETLSKFMVSCKPLLTTKEFDETMKEVDEMLKDSNVCSKLQGMLIERAANRENWFAEWWERAAYLEFRESVVVWSSPGATYAYRKHATDDEFITYAAKVILGMLRFKKLIDSGGIKQQYLGKVPLDMQQYQKFLGACRIPAISCDQQEFHPDSKHIIIACNNHFYHVDVIDDKAQAIGLEMLKKHLECILESSKERAPAVGLLTATNRDTWAKNYKLLHKHESNVDAIKSIQSSIMLLCLDKSIGEKCQKDVLTAGALQTVHGGGVCFNSGNRWMDKIIQLIVSRDGISGVTYEHSTAEAIPVMQMGDFIQDCIDKNEAPSSVANFKESAPQALIFKLDKEISEAIEQAGVEVDKIVDEFELSVIDFTDYGKEFIKEQKMSPDSFIQMLMQYAYYKVHGEPGAHYESASLRQFIHGRTEAIRSCSCESLDFAKAMMNKDVSDKEKIRALKSAITAHKNYAVVAMDGKGVDRHLLGLKMQALDAKMSLPNFFNSVGYKKSGTFMMGTSQVPTNYKGLMAYGPMTKDGYGICYNLRKNDILISVSSFKSSDFSINREMTEALTQGLKTVGKLLEGNKQLQSKL